MSSTTTTTTTTPSPSEDASISALRATLNQAYRLWISDGRMFEGAFLCTDREKNVILQDAVETSSPLAAGGKKKVQREVGMVMIPWKWVVKAEIEETDERSWREKMSGMYF
ncbi:hypothetical protein BDY24DRAFT_412298 [Mrakia frigida]|uniref:LSM domain-containing protein n=1 Tax=Mrakia frigida TaxID=29902 RepID=UPI003FCC039B